VHDVVVLEAAHHVRDGVDLADVREKLVAAAAVRRCVPAAAPRRMRPFAVRVNLLVRPLVRRAKSLACVAARVAVAQSPRPPRSPRC
jgi:hypothetical protein